MKALALVLFAALGLAFVWKVRQGRAGRAAAAESSLALAGGWTAIAPPSGTDPKRVLIVAPPNCPSAEGQRAVVLAQQLAARQIPCTPTGHVEFSFTAMDDAKRMEKIMNAAAPIVFVNQKAKSNPTLEEVVAEYRELARK